MAGYTTQPALQHADEDATANLPVEVIVGILLRLPTLDLLLAQGVCQRWHAIIKGDPTIQKKLWFREVCPVDENNGWIDCDSPGFFALQGYMKFGRKPLGGYKVHTRDIVVRRLRDPKDIPEKVARPEASWRRMLLTQPPVNRRVYIHDRDYRKSDGHGRRGPFRDSEGIKIGQLVPISEEEDDGDREMGERHQSPLPAFGLFDD
jgi:hypothetical protein